ncbi:MAG: hypothetical protein ABSF95_10210 [Verrucomicrobiota bacterium]
MSQFTGIDLEVSPVCYALSLYPATAGSFIEAGDFPVLFFISRSSATIQQLNIRRLVSSLQAQNGRFSRQPGLRQGRRGSTFDKCGSTFWSGGGSKARESAANKAGERSTAASRRGGPAAWRSTALAILAALAALPGLAALATLAALACSIGHIGWIGHIGHFFQKTGRAAVQNERVAINYRADAHHKTPRGHRASETLL